VVFFFLFQINHSISQTVYSDDNNDNVEVTSLTDKIYLLKETISFTANIVAFAGSDGVIFFDTGFKNYIDMVETTIGIVRKEMAAGKSLKEIQNADVLKDWGDWAAFFEFITKESWIKDIYLCYSKN
jgi:hypothetical protein